MTSKIFAAIIFGLLLLPIAMAEQQEVYVLLLKHDGVSISKEQLYVTSTNYIEEFSVEGRFYGEILSFEDEVLYSRHFDISLEFTGSADPRWFDEEGNQVVIPEKEFIVEEIVYKELVLPYFSHGEKIIISKDEQEVLSIDLTSFARTCGDEQCQAHEDAGNCAEDCGRITREIEEVIVEETAGVEELRAENQSLLYVILAGVLMIVIGIMIYIVRKIRKVKVSYTKGHK